MPVPSRTAFLVGLTALRQAVNEPVVRAGNETGSFLRRGLAVSSYNLLETFTSDRLTELAERINGGQTQFLDLPEKLQRRAITNTIEVANSQLRRLSKADVAQLRTYSSDVGTALRAVDTTLELSPMTWLWAHSNMSASDLHAAMRYLHVDDPFINMRKLADRLAFPTSGASGQPLDLREDLESLAQERHKCAHEASYGVTSIWIRTVPERILRLAITFDCLASLGAVELRSGNIAALQNDKFVDSGSLKFRFVRERSKDYGEIIEGKWRAAARARDPEALYQSALSRCQQNEVLVEQTTAMQVVRWDIAGID